MDDKTRREIDKIVERTLREAKLTEPPIQVSVLIDHLQLYREFYSDAPFVRLRGGFPETKATVGSNYCDVAVRVDAAKGLVVGLAALDNLVKGASGQAVQCMNLMFDLPEEEGLCQAPLYP